MINRSILAAILAVGTGTAALAEVQVKTPGVQVQAPIGAVSGDQVYADIGGFLGIGETRVLLTPDKIASVKNDRIVLKLTENEAKNLPSVDDKPAVK